MAGTDWGIGPMRRVRRVHFVGIGGAGMGGIAEVLAVLGFEVTGSDLAPNAMTARLQGLGVRVHIGHEAGHASGCDAVVISTAVPPDNPEVLEARARGIPVVPRAEMLAELMRLRHGIAVAGTHGKTTTTSLVASVLGEAGLDPTYVIGGRLLASGAHARLGSGEFLVAEADESDGSFLYLKPELAVVTNIDEDHMGTYGGDRRRLMGAFGQFIHQLPFWGLALVCADDPGVRELLPQITRPVRTYGFGEGAHYRAREVERHGLRSRFRVERPDGAGPLELELALPGRHNILNALAAVAVGHELGLADDAVARALGEFQGIGRRFERHEPVWVGGARVTVVDDYAHHPSEIAATLAAARSVWPERRLVVVFQPHRYTRTRDLFDDFVDVLADTDRLLLTEVYPAGEAPIQGADGRALARAIRARGAVDPVLVPELERVAPVLEDIVRDDDVLLILGAGSIGALAGRLEGSP